MYIYRYIINLWPLVFAFGCSNQPNTVHSETSESKINSSDSSQIIKYMDQGYSRIESAVSGYEIVEKEIHDESSLGALLTVYYDKNSLRKIDAAYCSDTGKIKLDYYYIGDDYLFLRKRQFIYNKPIYYLNSTVLYIREDKYYFYKNRLFLWMKGDKSMIRDSPEFRSANFLLTKDLARLSVLQDQVPVF